MAASRAARHPTTVSSRSGSSPARRLGLDQLDAKRDALVADEHASSGDHRLHLCWRLHAERAGCLARVLLGLRCCGVGHAQLLAAILVRPRLTRCQVRPYAVRLDLTRTRRTGLRALDAASHRSREPTYHGLQSSETDILGSGVTGIRGEWGMGTATGGRGRVGGVRSRVARCSRPMPPASRARRSASRRSGADRAAPSRAADSPGTRGRARCGAGTLHRPRSLRVPG